MLDIKTVKRSFLNAAGAILYISSVAVFMFNLEGILGHREDNILMPIGFLSLLVVSAATMGMLVFGKPVMLYLDGKKREGAAMVVYTIGILAFFTILLFAVLVIR